MVRKGYKLVWRDLWIGEGFFLILNKRRMATLPLKFIYYLFIIFFIDKSRPGSEILLSN